MKRNYKSCFACLFLAAILLSALVLPANAAIAAVNLLNVMDAHMYRDEAISADATLTYRIYMPDALSPYFPAGADNVKPPEEEIDPEFTLPDATQTPSVPDDLGTFGILIWLHDEDSRGDDNVAHISDDSKNGLISALLSDTERAADTIVIAPQCPMQTTWSDNDGLYLKLLVSLLKNHLLPLNVDPERIFIGGISMGAQAGYALIEDSAQADAMQIAGAYLVAGAVDTEIADEAAAAPYKNTKIFAFLSENDSVTPPDSVRTLADTLIGYGCAFNYVVYPDIGHEVWHQAFMEAALLSDFLSVNAPKPVEPETEAVTEEAVVTETETLHVETVPVETEPAETEPLDKPLTIGDFEITNAVIAYVIMGAACVLAAIMLIAGLVKNSKVR